MIIAFDLVKNLSLKSMFSVSLIAFLFRFFKNSYVILLKKIKMSLNRCKMFLATRGIYESLQSDLYELDVVKAFRYTS